MIDSDITDALGDFFAETWPLTDPRDESTTMAEHVWASVRDLGLQLIGVDEMRGGSGGGLGELVQVAILCGKHAIDVPLLETALAAWAASRAGFAIDPLSIGSIHTGESNLRMSDGRASGTLERVPWGRSADHVVAHADDGSTVRLAVAEADIRMRVDLAGQPCDDLIFDEVEPIDTGAGVTADEFMARALTLRIAQSAGALRSACDLTQRYAQQREQFGRPIGDFQAVQIHLVQLEQMAVMTRAVVDALAFVSGSTTFDVLAAKLVADENAATAIAAAHQAHGAIGMTREYGLQMLTRRLHVWTGDFVDTQEVAARLGSALVDVPSVAGVVLDTRRRSEIVL